MHLQTFSDIKVIVLGTVKECEPRMYMTPCFAGAVAVVLVKSQRRSVLPRGQSAINMRLPLMHVPLMQWGCQSLYVPHHVLAGSLAT